MFGWKPFLENKDSKIMYCWLCLCSVYTVATKMCFTYLFHDIAVLSVFPKLTSAVLKPHCLPLKIFIFFLRWKAGMNSSTVLFQESHKNVSQCVFCHCIIALCEEDCTIQPFQFHFLMSCLKTLSQTSNFA